MKRRILSKMTYIGLSVGFAALMIFTALPYYLQTSIAFPGWNIYWGYGDVQRKMMWLFPGMALIGAMTTLRKKNTIEDVFLNIAAPLIVLLALRCLQYHPILVAVTLGFVALVIDCTLSRFWEKSRFQSLFSIKRYESVTIVLEKRVDYYYSFF